MKNSEKFKTAKERTKAFEAYCHGKKECENYRKKCHKVLCVLEWLDIEADEEKLMPCPFCGQDDLYIHKNISNFWVICCQNCSYASGMHADKPVCISRHNRVCEAVAAYKEGEVK